MSDIIMCSGGSGSNVCPMRESCFRFTATASPTRQSYFMTIPLVWGGALLGQRMFPECEHYWPNEGRK